MHGHVFLMTYPVHMMNSGSSLIFFDPAKISSSKSQGEKTKIRLIENKGTDQLRSNCEAGQRRCFRYMNSTIPLLPKFPASSQLLCLYSSAFVRLGRKSRRPDLCRIAVKFTYPVQMMKSGSGLIFLAPVKISLSNFQGESQ